MMNEDLQNILCPFAVEPGPAHGVNPEHCDECREADGILSRLTPECITYEDITARAWALSFVTDLGLRWLMPGIVRAALDRSRPDPSAIFDLITQRYDDIFTDDQWLAVVAIAEYCVEKNLITREEADCIGPGKCMRSQPEN